MHDTSTDQMTYSTEYLICSFMSQKQNKQVQDRKNKTSGKVESLKSQNEHMDELKASTFLHTPPLLH